MASDANGLNPTPPRVVRVLLGVVVIVLLLAGAAVGREYVTRARHRIHLRAAIPKVCEDLRHERQALVRAIEAYKSKLGAYPPDHVLSREPLQVDEVTNQLLYELLGTFHDPASDTFSPPLLPSVQRDMLKSFFNTDAIKNNAGKVEEVQHFLKPHEVEATFAVHNKPDVALLGYFPSWEGIEPDLFAQIELSSWRYNSSAPVHNPGAYDLWIEVKTVQTNILLGNW